MSGIKVKVTNNPNKQSLTKNIYKILLSKKDKENKEFDINIGDNVRSKVDSLTGTIQSFDSNKIIILWDDNTRERFSYINFYNDMEIYKKDIIDKKDVINENVEEIETRKIIPQQNNVGVKEEKSELDNLYDLAFNEMEDEFDDIIDANPNKLKEQRINRQINSMERKIEEKKINNIKEKAVNEVISLMKEKNMISNNSTERLKKEELLKMNDIEFENFKESILNNSINSEPKLSEAEMMLERIKNGGPIIGGFDKNTVSSSVNRGETRTLSGRTNELYDSNNQVSEMTREASSEGPKLNFDGFRNLQGLTKPLQVPNEQKSMKENLSTAIADLGWTTVSKIY